uniref:Uncharacterized protein n=1 Tax=Sphaerodactylus townsendi TaxID=933632 RepID=A0ACB8E791_9SAUR
MAVVRKTGPPGQDQKFLHTLCFYYVYHCLDIFDTLLPKEMAFNERHHDMVLDCTDKMRSLAKPHKSTPPLPISDFFHISVLSMIEEKTGYIQSELDTGI